MKRLMTRAFACAVCSAGAYSLIDAASITWIQRRNGFVTVGYTLTGAPAYVTAEFLTNGVSVGAAEQVGLSGDVNRIVRPGTRQLTWQMQEDALAKTKLPEGSWTVKLTATDFRRLPTYMAVNLADGSMVFYAATNNIPGGVGDAKWKTTHMLLRRIPAANVTARLGLGLGDYKNSNYNYAPPYERTFAEDFYMAIYETTQGQSIALGDSTASTCGQNSFNSLNNATHKTVHATDWQWHPVDNATYQRATTVAATLTARAKANGGYRLVFAVPDEDQWEYACRAGCSKDAFFGARQKSYSAKVNDYIVNFQTAKSYYGGDQNGGFHPTYSDAIPVGLKLPNAWGLYDMLGNVSEWCTATQGGTSVRRGGDVVMSGETATAACREPSSGSRYGYRLICTLSLAE